MHQFFLAPEPESEREPFTDPSGGSPAPQPPLIAVEKVATSGEDPEQARRFFTEAYAGARFTVSESDEPFSFRYASVSDERVTLRTVSVVGQVRGEVPRLDEYVVTWLQSGSGRIRLRGAEPIDLPNAPFILPHERHYTFTLSPHRQNSVHFAPAFLEDIASERGSGDRLPVAFDTAQAPSPSRVTAWRRSVAEATDVLVDVDAPPLLRLDAERLLGLALLDLFPWAAFELPDHLRGSSLTRTRVALEYLHHHAHEPITAADAARAAGLHPRTLQLHLARHLDTSPTAYLRDIRLDRVRAELTEQSPDDTTVAIVARRWGFAHLGRFSAAYRARFGARPNETLRG